MEYRCVLCVLNVFVKRRCVWRIWNDGVNMWDDGKTFCYKVIWVTFIPYIPNPPTPSSLSLSLLFSYFTSSSCSSFGGGQLWSRISVVSDRVLRNQARKHFFWSATETQRATELPATLRTLIYNFLSKMISAPAVSVI